MRNMKSGRLQKQKHRSIGQGQVLVLGVLIMVGIVALLGGVIDVGYLSLQQQNLQGALDTAVKNGLSKVYADGDDPLETVGTILAENVDLPCTIDAGGSGGGFDCSYGDVEVTVEDNTETAECVDSVLTVTYPYNNDDLQLYAELTVPLRFLFYKLLESDENTITVKSHAQMTSDTSEWPSFQQNPPHTGENEGTTFTPPLRKDWTYWALGRTRTQAVIHDGMVYFGAGTYLYALDARTGSFQWKTNVGLMDGCTPTVTGNRIYIGTNYGYDTVYCFNTSGGLVWSTRLRSIGTTAGLAVDGQYVYQQSSADGALYVYDVNSGQPIQPNVPFPLPGGDPSYLNTGLPGPGGTGGFSTPALYAQKVHFATGDGNCMAYNIAGWTAAWATNLSGAGNLDSPLIYDGKLYYGGNSKVYCLDPNSGATLWTNTVGSRASSLAGAAGTVVVGTNSSVRAMDANTGADLWSSGSNRYTVCAIAKGYVYSINAQSRKGLRIYSLSDGTETQVLTDSLDAYYRDNGPAVGHGMVICPGNNTWKITAYTPLYPSQARLVE